MSLLSKLRGEDRTPIEVGLTMLVVNMILMGGFALSIGAFLLLSLIGVPIPPFVVILAFAMASLFLWVYLGKSFPQSFSVLAICQSLVIGISPIALATAAEYTFRAVDPEGCVGAHLLILFLGSVALIVQPVATIGGLIYGRLRKII